MNDELRTLLQNFLAGHQTIEDVRDWVALNIWQPSSEGAESTDQLAIMLSHVDDGRADEEVFCAHIWGMLGIIRQEVDQWEGSVYSSTTSTDHFEQAQIEDPLIPAAPIRAAHSFA